MIPREIHDPAVLAIIAEECDYAGRHSYLRNAKIAYLAMARAATSLKAVILTGKFEKVECPACKRLCTLTSDGTFKYHSGCPMAGQTLEAAIAMAKDKTS